MKKKLSNKKTINLEEEFFKELFVQYSKAIFAFILKRISNKTLAEDLLQDVYLKVWNNRKSLDKAKNIKAYLYTTANNVLIDYYRKKKIFVDEDFFDSIDFKYLQKTNFDLGDKISVAVSQLPKMQKKVFTLSRFDQLKHKEIAELLNISIKTVESHIGKALQSLRVELKYLKKDLND